MGGNYASVELNMPVEFGRFYLATLQCSFTDVIVNANLAVKYQL